MTRPNGSGVRRCAALVARVCLALLTFVGVCLVGGDGKARGQGDDLVVVAYEVEPFLVRTGDVPGGLMYEVWTQVAALEGWSFELEWVDSLEELGDALAAGDADVALAPLSSTSERERRFDFTSAVVASGPAFGVHARTENPVTLASALFSRDTLRLLVWSAIGLLVLGHLMWLAERRNPDADVTEGYVRGVWDGVWWAAVTVTTVGYGDATPKTSRGRMVAILAMLGSLLLVGAFVSEVSAALQAGRAETVVGGIDDLDGRPVAVVEGASYQLYLDDQGVETVTFPTQIEAFEAVEAGDLDVVVADEYTLDVVADEYGLRVPADTIYDEFLAFGLPEESPLRNQINAQLSELQRQGVVREIVERWTG